MQVLVQKKEKYRYSSIVISTAIGEDGPETDSPPDVVFLVNSDIQDQWDVVTTINKAQPWPIVSLADANAFAFNLSTTLVFLNGLHNSL